MVPGTWFFQLFLRFQFLRVRRLGGLGGWEVWGLKVIRLLGYWVIGLKRKKVERLKG